MDSHLSVTQKHSSGRMLMLPCANTFVMSTLKGDNMSVSCLKLVLLPSTDHKIEFKLHIDIDK